MSPDDEKQNENDSHTTAADYQSEVGKKEQRKLRARRNAGRGIWFGLGMFGMVGWSIAIPTLIGIALGAWLDRVWAVRFSWTLTCLFMGVVAGCAIAWYWVQREVEES